MLLADRRVFVELAKQILRHLDPTSEDRILADLEKNRNSCERKVMILSLWV